MMPISSLLYHAARFRHIQATIIRQTSQQQKHHQRESAGALPRVEMYFIFCSLLRQFSTRIRCNSSASPAKLQSLQLAAFHVAFLFNIVSHHNQGQTTSLPSPLAE